MKNKAKVKPAAVLVADPPWLFGDALPGKKRGASKNYRCLTVEEICKFDLPPLADDCVLFLWRVAAMQREALKVIRAWGFELKAEIVWRKTTKNGKRHFGMGRIVRAEHETCLIAVRGKPKVKNHSQRSTFRAPVGRHSEKPERFFKIVEKLFDGPYAEMFARRLRKGWTVYGDQIQYKDGVVARPTTSVSDVLRGSPSRRFPAQKPARRSDALRPLVLPKRRAAA